MTAFLMITGGATLIGAAIAYIMWVDLRVIEFREDLFLIRDELWDRMRERGELDLEDHQTARRCINSTIRFAPRLSLTSVFSALGNGVQRTSNPIEDEEIQEYMDRVVLRSKRYIFDHSLMGWILKPTIWCVFIATRLIPKRRADAQASTWANRFLMSEEMLHDRFCPR